MYTVVPGPKGTKRYKKDSRFVKKADIPADVLIKLEVGMKNIEQTVEPNNMTCIFCNLPTRRYRLFQQKNVYLCEDDYYDKTIGQIAHQLHKIGD